MADGHDAYGRIARFYDAVLEPLNAPLRRTVVAFHPPVPGMRVLDVGCGTGAHLDAYVESGAVCTGVDMSPAMLAVARERLGTTATLDVADATNLPYGDGSFDLTFSSMILHELDPGVRTTILDEMLRVTDPAGRILVIDYRAGAMRWQGHGWRAVSTLAERIAGGRHYRNWRRYLAAGGLPAIVPTGGIIEREKIVAGGNLALWLIERT
jgi:ubiquinone/menaquinone biosynthesis C-methylase UbiE